MTDFLFIAAVIAVIFGLAHGTNMRERARSRRGHADVAATGRGAWTGVIADDQAPSFFEGLSLSIFKSVFFFDNGVPVRLEVSPEGLRMTMPSRLLRKHSDRVWSAPWDEVVRAEVADAGFKRLGGKRSTVRLTDVRITTVGPSAQPFLEAWELTEPDEDELPLTPDEVKEQAEWRAYAAEELGPSWHPGTALLIIRTSAPDQLVETITRWARGQLPAGPA